MEGHPEVTADNWDGGVQGVRKETVYHEDPFSFNPEHLQDAEEAFQDVLKLSGASYVRDPVDQRVVHEVRTGTTTYMGPKTKLPGIIDSQEDVGGWPELESTEAPTDTDRDGMPDSWETENNLNPEDASDGKEYTINENYTNVEVYLNSLVEHKMKWK